MRRSAIKRVFLAATVFLALAAGARAQEACREEMKPAGQAHAFSGALDEPARMGLSAAVLITLQSDKPEWPCPLDTFTAGGVTWTLSGGTEWAPPRVARAEGRSDYVFLALGPSFAEAYDYVREGSGGSLKVKKPSFYLTLVRERARHVLRVYDGFPAAAELKADMAAALEGRLVRVAVYDPDSDAVTVSVATKSGIHSQLFRPTEPGHPVTLWGPDGYYYSTFVDGGTRLRGSGFACPAQLETFVLTDMMIFNGSDENLDLTCRFFDGDAWITAFVTRFEGAPDAASVFADYRRASTSVSKIAHEESPLLSAGGPNGPDHALSWTDEKGLGQSLWLTRRGHYYVEVRATYPTGDADKAAAASRTLHRAIVGIPETAR